MAKQKRCKALPGSVEQEGSGRKQTSVCAAFTATDGHGYCAVPRLGISEGDWKRGETGDRSTTSVTEIGFQKWGPEVDTFNAGAFPEDPTTGSQTGEVC